MYYRCLLDNMLRSSRHFHLMVMTCSLKALIYCIPLRLILWGESYYTKILSPSCDKTFDIPTCPESQLMEWKLNGFSSILHENSQHCACPFIQERYPCSHRPYSVSHKWCHCLLSLVHKWLLPELLCHRRRNMVP